MPEQESQPFGRNTCHICGGTDFAWGYMYEFSQHGMCFIESSEPPKSPKVLFSDFKVDPKPVRARCCLTCNNLQFFATDSDKSKDA